ncbi:DUF4998 domain-containing protein [uncultured Bacteroides sp.]|uniref:DUF4998 domain-containing protein n=1 Tax=uncultured Bacteroides sp. TaxID=162156 RepID=UPI0025D0F69D|nr:DUF4998 domain-containing protein [uncultured Bacteroides sp.]
MKKYIGLLVVILAMVSCESLEDTYKDYAGDGPIRYLGKCTDLVVRPGWNRLIVSWTNSADPVIDKIKITWSKDGVVKEQLLDREINSFNIPDLEDGNYEITVCSIDKEGNTSLKSPIYGRPYTANHEMVQSFTQIVSNHYFLKNRLVLLFQGWEENVTEACLTYTRSDGSTGRIELDEQLVNKLYYLLPDAIDTSKPVELYRSGRIPGCDDEIVFAPTKLDNVRLFNADFKQEMKRQFGFDEDIPDNWASTVEEISFDWTIGSFSDLLNLPNLKKLVLGKHRYIRDELVNDSETAQSKVYDAALSDFVLKTLHELNPDFVVERYNKHYSNLTQAEYLEEKGATSVPDYSFLDLSNLKFTSSPADAENYKSSLECLTDNNIETIWEPAGTKELTTYSLTLDLKTERNLQGLKLVQTYFENENKRSWCPGIVKIFVSKDSENWENATYLEELEIGHSTGEVNIIPFVEGGKQAQYVKVVVSTPHSESIYNISLAEIGLY